MDSPKGVQAVGADGEEGRRTAVPGRGLKPFGVGWSAYCVRRRREGGERGLRGNEREKRGVWVFNPVLSSEGLHDDLTTNN